jgi:hypothetical protein
MEGAVERWWREESEQLLETGDKLNFNEAFWKSTRNLFRLLFFPMTNTLLWHARSRMARSSQDENGREKRQKKEQQQQHHHQQANGMEDDDDGDDSSDEDYVPPDAGQY